MVNPEALFLEVQKKGKAWNVRLVDVFDRPNPVTSWVKLPEINDLRRTRGKPIRDKLKTEWKNPSDIIERILIMIEAHKEAWNPEPEQKGEEQQQPHFSEDAEGSITVEVARIVEAENQLEALEPHLDNVLVGEEATKKAIFTLATSGKYPEAEKKQMILLKGESGGGKSTIQVGATIGFKTKVVGRFTAHGLDYADLESYEVLMLKEIGKMDEEQQGISTLKFLSSDDKGYTVEMPVRDPETGRFKNTQYRIPAITVISSTTRLILDTQFERRTWPFNVDETEEQTKKVALWKAERKRQENEKKLGYRKYTDYEFSKEVIRRFVRGFEPLSVIIPFPKALTEFLEYDVLRVRGDIDKVYSFLEFYGAFNKKRLDLMEGPNGQAYALTPEICIEALKIILNPLTNMLGKMDERARLIFNALTEIEDVEEEYIDGEQQAFEKLVRYDKAGTEIDKKLRERIAVKISKSDNTVRKFLSFLETSGFVSSTGGRGRTPKTFTLLYDIKHIQKRIAGLSCKLETPDNLLSEMRKEAQKWRGSLLNAQTLAVGNNFSEKNVPDLLETEKIIPTATDPTFNKELGINSPSFAQTHSDSRAKEKRTASQQKGVTPQLLLMENMKEKDNMLVNSITGEVAYLCKICKKTGKHIIFSTEHDLNFHLQNFHGKKPTYVS